MKLTGGTQARACCKFGNVDYFCSKLLIRLPMYASAYDGEWSSEKKEREIRTIEQTRRMLARRLLMNKTVL